jgi:tRNA-splicing endonuclease subunit Sen2
MFITVKLTAEELTAKRRVERKESKIQKSKLKQLAMNSESVAATSIKSEETLQETKLAPKQKLAQLIPEDLMLEVEKIEDLEHLQLMNEEAFFLTFGLGCLDVSLSAEVRVFVFVQVVD